MFEDFRLRVFTQVAESGSFTAAARSLGVSQPAVSQHIAELEKFTGARLFERNRGQVLLTARGEAFLAQARRILDDYHELELTFRPPESILIRNVRHEGRKTNILILRDRFADLDAPADTPADRILEADGLAILPSFFNTHTHAAMTLLRGYADDLPLQEWLAQHIWPSEGALSPEGDQRVEELTTLQMRATQTT